MAAFCGSISRAGKASLGRVFLIPSKTLSGLSSYSLMTVFILSLFLSRRERYVLTIFETLVYIIYPLPIPP
jgi:hypothetical protein